MKSRPKKEARKTGSLQIIPSEDGRWGERIFSAAPDSGPSQKEYVGRLRRPVIPPATILSRKRNLLVRKFKLRSAGAVSGHPAEDKLESLC
jgi:hypothetical protein